MATKRTRKPRKSAIDPRFVDSDGNLTLDADLFLRWRAAEANVRCVSAERSLVQKQYDDAVKANPTLRDLQAQINDFNRQAMHAKQEMIGVNTDIEKALGVALVECSIDDKTGKLHVLSTGAPMAATRTKRKRKE